MARRTALASALVLVLTLGACVGPPSLHQSVLGYDETISRLEREMLLLNIARVRNELPIHFTVTTSIAATFDYRVNAGVVGALLNPGANTYTFSLHQHDRRGCHAAHAEGPGSQPPEMPSRLHPQVCQYRSDYSRPQQALSPCR